MGKSSKTVVQQPDPVVPDSEKYADQIGVFRQIEQDKLNQQASAFNQQVSGLNDQFGEYNTNANNLFGTIQGLDMTADIGSYRQQLSDLQSQFGSQDWTLDRPEFQTTFNGINLYDNDAGNAPHVPTDSWDGVEGGGARRVYHRENGGDVQETAQRDLDEYNHRVDSRGWSADGYQSGSDLDTFAQYQSLLDAGWDYNDINPGGRFIDVTVGLSNPTLDSGINDFDINQINSLFQRGNDYLNQLQQKRDAEEARIANFTQDMRSQLGSYNSLLSGYDMGDQRQLNQLQQNLGFTLEDINGFDSKLDTDFSSLLAGFNNLQAGIDDLWGQRDAESGRIANYESQMLQGLDGLEQQLSGMNYSQLSDMNALRDEYQRRLDMANNFSSELDYDFSDELAQINQSKGALDALFQARGDEEQRIDSFRSGIEGRLRNLGTLADTTGIYDLGDITNLQTFLQGASGDINNFSSLLDFNLDDERFAVDLGQRQIDQLLDQRKNAIDSMFSAGDALSTDMGGVADYDEASIRNLLNLAREGADGANRFSGGRADDLQALYAGSVDDLNSRLSNIFSQRDTIESDLAAMLEGARGTEFLDLNQVGGLESELAGLRELKNQWGATQAGDELAALNSLLGGERARLEQDGTNVANQQNAAIQEILSQLDENGNLTFKDLSFRDPVTQSAYEELVRNGYINPEDEEETRRQLQSVFSRNLGIIQG